MKFLIIAITILSPGFAFSQGTPTLTLQEDSFDHGIIQEGDSVSHSFTITNSGTQELIIDNIEVTCSCLLPSISNFTIQPGSSAQLTVLFDTSGKFGKQEKLVTLISNASEPIARIAIKGEIVPSD